MNNVRIKKPDDTLQPVENNAWPDAASMATIVPALLHPDTFPHLKIQTVYQAWISLALLAEQWTPPFPSLPLCELVCLAGIEPTTFSSGG